MSNDLDNPNSPSSKFDCVLFSDNTILDSIICDVYP
jgi:hypothetical protein